MREWEFKGKVASVLAAMEGVQPQPSTGDEFLVLAARLAEERGIFSSKTDSISSGNPVLSAVVHSYRMTADGGKFTAYAHVSIDSYMGKAWEYYEEKSKENARLALDEMGQKYR